MTILSSGFQEHSNNNDAAELFDEDVDAFAKLRRNCRVLYCCSYVQHKDANSTPCFGGGLNESMKQTENREHPCTVLAVCILKTEYGTGGARHEFQIGKYGK